MVYNTPERWPGGQGRGETMEEGLQEMTGERSGQAGADGDGREPLSIRQLYRLSLVLCKKIDHPPVSFAAVRRHVEENMPLVLESQAGFVWIDRLYAAFEEMGEPFRYVYLHAGHIREERLSYAQADPEGKDRDWISPDILKGFERAEREMRIARRLRWVDSRMIPYLTGTREVPEVPGALQERMPPEREGVCGGRAAGR